MISVVFFKINHLYIYIYIRVHIVRNLCFAPKRLAEDRRPGCQPMDPNHPERFYLPPSRVATWEW